MIDAAGALSPLATLLSAQARIERLVASVRTRGMAGVYGAPHAAATAVAAAVLAALDHQRPAQLLVVTGQPDAAAAWADELPLWLPHGVRTLLFPALEDLPYERRATEPTIVQQRQAVLGALLSREPVAVVTSARALLQPLMDPTQFAATQRRFEAGGHFGTASELLTWRSLGYRPVPVVQAQGDYSRRGGIIDVYPAGAEWPVRIELVGSEIESLRQFDPATQRSRAALQQCSLGPVHAFLLPAPAEALHELRALDVSTCLPHVATQWGEDLKALAEGTPFDGMEFYAPYLVRPATSILPYLSENGFVVVDDPEAQREIVDDLLAQAEEIHAELVGRREIPAGLRAPLLAGTAVLQDLTLLPHLEWHSRPGTHIEDWSDGSVFRSAPSYAGSLKRFVQDCDELRRQQERICIVSLQAPRLAELLRDEHVPTSGGQELQTIPERGSIVAIPCALSEGFYAPNAHLIVFTDAEVAGWSRPRPAPRFHRPATESFALDFAPGDFIVHVEYGIGRFQGVVREGAGRSEREYLDIQFAGTDRLKVPTDKLDRVTKYRGMGETSPTLSRLGTQEWTRTKAKIRESVQAVARELLDLYRFREKAEGHPFAADNHWQKELEAAFPYEETPDQERAILDVKADMEAPRPMDRLVCGDVGYGKTEVAIRAAFKAVMGGKQVAVLVPTTVLAQQHYNTFRERMQAYPVRVGVLSRFHSRADQLKVLDGTRNGTVDIVVGTHRLLQKDVTFKDLGLLVIDEEQRFGVKAKEQLKQFRRSVDVLTLTATPIPRSLHMALVQVRDLSVIATPPEGRLPIRTFLEPFDEFHIREAILREIDRGGQVYFVHNRVQTIEAIAERLRYLVPHARLAVAHGQMPEGALERVMFDFAGGAYDILICSTIIESGLDIPNVNTMIVNDAPQFGLAQLHQLRGRIGRGSRRGYAYLLYNPHQRITRIAERRLKAIFETNDLGAGFQIAMIDLEIRGAGNVLGSAQHGQMAAVGFQLYAGMLSEAIAQQRGTATDGADDEPQSQVSIPADAFIPSSYVEDENQRLRLYQRLAACGTVPQVAALQDEMRDRFGPLPEPVLNMLATMRIRLKARLLHITSVQLDPSFLILRGSPMVAYDRLAAYTRYGRDVRIDRGVLRVPARMVQAEPLQHAEEILDKALTLANLEALPEPDPLADQGSRGEVAAHASQYPVR